MATRENRVTLEDVAAATGFSRALVSIVMRNAPGASEVTRQRVKDAANKLGYKPDVHARALASIESKTIGVVFGVAGSFHLKLLDGLYSAAEKHGFNLILSAVTPARDEAKAVESLQNFILAGLIMLGPARKSVPASTKFPVAVIGWELPDGTVDSVQTSDEAGMHLAVAHLARLGHSAIAHIDGGDGLIAVSRAKAYAKAMIANGLEANILVIAAGESSIDGQRAADAVIQMADRPTAIIAYNDDVAIAASTHLMYAGISIPGDISVIGWDDSELATASEIPLTSVRQEPELMARLAFERVLERLAEPNGNFQSIVLEPQLVIRASTGKHK